MSAILKQFAGSTVSPKDDAILYKIFNEQSGVIKGCEITYLGSNQIRVGSGYLYLFGRLIEVEEETVLSPFSESEAAGELILKIDLLSDTPAVLQARTPVQELVQGDLDEGDSVYEYLLATYTVTDVAITGLTIAYEVVSAGFSKDKVLATLAEVEAATEKGFLIDALVVKELNAKLNMRYCEEEDTLQVYYNSTWNNVLKCMLQEQYIFKAPEQYTDVTGGWKLSAGYTEGGITLTQYDTYMELYIAYATYFNGTIRTINTIDLTNFKTLRVKYGCAAANHYVGITKESSSSYNHSLDADFGTMRQTTEITDDVKTVDVDLTNVEGDYYITMGLTNGSGTKYTTKLKIYEVSLFR